MMMNVTMLRRLAERTGCNKGYVIWKFRVTKVMMFKRLAERKVGSKGCGTGKSVGEEVLPQMRRSSKV